MKIIGVVGTRRRTSARDRILITNEVMRIYEKGDWICSGGCPTGADSVAEKLAKTNGIPILTFYPHWNKYNKAAGPIRNTLIADHVDVLIACVARDRKGGTEDTIKKFEKVKPLGKVILV